MAAHLEGRGVGVLDMAGLAQKGGAVFSHIRFAEKPEDIHAIRVAAGRADLVLGGDIVVAGTRKMLAAVKHGATEMVGQYRRVPAGRIYPQRRFLAAERAAQAHHRRRCRRRQNAFHRRHADRQCAVRPVDRRQHVYGRLRLSARRNPAVCRRHRKAIELNGEAVSNEPCRLPLGPPRRGRSRRGRKTGATGNGDGQRCAALSESFDGDSGAAREIPHRLSERRLCGALSGHGR